jgi:hypothetical protein
MKASGRPMSVARLRSRWASAGAVDHKVSSIAARNAWNVVGPVAASAAMNGPKCGMALARSSRLRSRASGAGVKHTVAGPVTG